MRSIALIFMALFVTAGAPANVECRRELVPGAGVTFIECADRTTAIVTHGDDAHCVPGGGSPRERRHISCDDGLTMRVEAGSCALLSGDATRLPAAVSSCVLR